MEGKKVVKAGIGYTVGNYLIKGLAFLTLPIFARIMTTEDFGTYNVFVAYEGIFLYLIGLGLDTSFKSARFRYGFDQEHPRNLLCYEEYVSTVVSMIIGNAMIWLFAIIVFRKQFGALLKLDFPSLIMLILFSLSNAIILCYNAHASISYNYKGFVYVGAVNAVGSITLSIFLITHVFTKKAYLGRMLGATSVIIMLAAFIWIMFLRTHRPGNVKTYTKWGLAYSLPIVPHGISQVLLVSFDRIMIDHMVGSGPSGIYSFAYNIFAIVYVTYRSLDPVWSTWFFEKMKAKDYSSIKKYSTAYMIIMLVISAAVILVSPELVVLLGSAKYSDAIYCVIPITAGGFFTFLYSIPCQVEYYREKTGYIAGATMCAAAINIVLNYVCINKYGYVAAAYTTLVTYMLYFLFHLYLARRIEGKMLFSKKSIIFCSVSILLVGFTSIRLIEHILLRIGFLIVLMGATAGLLWRAHGDVIMHYLNREQSNR